MRMVSDRFQHLELGRLNNRDHLLAFHRGKTIEKVFDGFTTFKIINQVLQRNAGADKDRRAAHDFRIGMNHAVEGFHLHGGSITASWFDCLLHFPDQAASAKPSSWHRVMKDPQLSIFPARRRSLIAKGRTSRNMPTPPT